MNIIDRKFRNYYPVADNSETKNFSNTAPFIVFAQENAVFRVSINIITDSRVSISSGVAG